MNIPDFSKYPCGTSGLEFPNGLPKKGQAVEVKTVWSEGQWETVIFQEEYGYENPRHQYEWFGVYAKPCVYERNYPIVLEWRTLPRSKEGLDHGG